LSASNIVKAVELLKKSHDYEYVSKRNHARIRIVNVVAPEGPIIFKRYSPSKKETASSREEETISSQLIWRVANALSSGQPINLDRILGGSYNTRSVLEALLAHTPQFYMCFPGRVQQEGSNVSIEKGHKHLWWQPDNPHEAGKIIWLKTDKVVSEVTGVDATYDAIGLAEPKTDLPENVVRRHAQIQIALIKIGESLGFLNSVAVEDQGISYAGSRLIEMSSVVKDISSLPQVSSYPKARAIIRHVDVVWFRNGRLVPAAIEIEHSTGVKSGLDRLKGLQDELPPFPIRYVIVADESERQRVVKFAGEERFRKLNVRFFSYAAVEELYSLCTRRKLYGVSEEFLDSFMEPTVS
jgi:type II restriction enzyme